MMRKRVNKILPLFNMDSSSIDDFYIQLDNPHKVYLPGEEISGQVVLICKRNVSNITITLSLLGFIKINASSHSKLRPLRHTLFDHAIKIYGKDQNDDENNDDELSNGLLKGEHVFPFIVKLPNKRIFTSIDFGKGSINYTLKALIGNNSHYNSPSTPPIQDNSSSSSFSKKKFLQNPSYVSEKVISLVNPIDVSQLPKPKPKRLLLKDPRATKLSRVPTSNSTTNTLSSSDHSIMENTMEESMDHKSIKSSSSSVPTVKVILEVPQRGYLRGESIPIKLLISHLKKVQDINGIIITFVRVCRLDNGPDGVVESFRKDLQQLVLPLYVDPFTFQSEINSSVRVPADAFPTIVGCPLVSFQYFVEVLINLSGKSIALESDVETHTQPTNPVNSSFDSYKFNFNSNQNERSNYINTDKYKRSKKFLPLTTEICIGTHRSATGVKLESQDLEESISRRSSSMVSHSNSNLSPAIFTSSTPNSPVDHQQVPPAIPSIPESSVVNVFTPPYDHNDVPQYVPNTAFEHNLHHQNGLSEKERMRQLETSLLPSAPPDDEDEPDMYQLQSSSPPPIPQMSQNSVTPDESQSNGIHQFRFFTYQNGSNTPPHIQLDDDLYQEPTDTAPNYLTVNNDRLIVPQDHSNSDA
ncbi:RIM8 pH-response regulator protein palF/RIM8 [Candida maltosa Xu316]